MLASPGFHSIPGREIETKANKTPPKDPLLPPKSFYFKFSAAFKTVGWGGIESLSWKRIPAFSKGTPL